MVTKEILELTARAIIYQSPNLTKAECVAAIIEIAELYAQDKNSGKLMLAAVVDELEFISRDMVCFKDQARVFKRLETLKQYSDVEYAEYCNSR